ncbi:hypothetical protein DR950_26160 [Kitasatospora xanthocidica]|uniref:Small hydrophobic protein n=1 Tax=Kitasatospora xanthocidica TaxID=83382 RepID=A0A372ZY61_9ACTN|nr:MULTISPECIES: DUF6126 family protein [Streptomycetaceae]OKI08993.1 hypothetical protein AMK13_11660 [Streptomyces sp. CB02056]RGD60789.1 hypothetical protein DR950_26160 [Kitasatospora xanthocidica]
MADPTTTVTPAADAENPAAGADTPAGPKTMDAGKWANKRVYHRLVLYTVGCHLFAGFIILLFQLGSRNK